MQQSLEQRNVQRLFRKEVKPQAIGGRKSRQPIIRLMK